MSRTALDGFPLGDIEKDFMLDLIRRYSKLYFVEILGFCLMGNHFHILVKMFPEYKYTDEDIKKRYEAFYGDERTFAAGWIPSLREKLSNLSEFVREIKVGFTRYYNKRHHRRGYFWGDRFKSVIVEKGETLINCLAYIDLNPLRAGLVARPEDYRWNSLGYHIQTGNKDNFLSLDFGLLQFDTGEICSAVTSELHLSTIVPTYGAGRAGVIDAKERLKHYRRYVYEAGAVNRPEKGATPEKYAPLSQVNSTGQAQVIGDKIVEKERKREFELSRSDRFRYRTRYFTDSGVIGSKEFVSENYQRFKDVFMSKREKIPRRVVGLDGVYSLKRLTA
jgi:REP element-mobilizing transposase RayT